MLTFKFDHDDISGHVESRDGYEFVYWGGAGFEISAARPELRASIEAARPQAIGTECAFCEHDPAVCADGAACQLDRAGVYREEIAAKHRMNALDEKAEIDARRADDAEERMEYRMLHGTE